MPTASTKPSPPASSPTVYRKNYRPHDFHITHTELWVDLDFATTTVRCRHQVQRRAATADELVNNLVLDCEAMQIVSVAIDGAPLSPQQFAQDARTLTLFAPPPQCTVTIECQIAPAENTALSGLYQSADILCTQCEAEGFRRLAPAIDRPDNLATFRVHLRADQARFPVLLSNGNPLAREDWVDDLTADLAMNWAADEPGRHTVVWDDPFPKPTYLFAMVAGDLACRSAQFTTMHGRTIALNFYAAARDLDKCAHAMTALQHAMRWDEEVYGREYDLDLFNVVAVEDFNMGAMENKSLNIFNTRYILADARMATDADYENIESVIAHEYFHNWSGNRVTCRDWFQLSLKEGFTVFRDQQFSAAMGSAGVKRIDDVDVLRAQQFKEDRSALAHPVRPESYQEINNFYTVTIYNKGAEVVRMLHTLLGAHRFRLATDYYFQQHDGQAVTCDDFVAAMAYAARMTDATDATEATDRTARTMPWAFEPAAFTRWYAQAGTPRVQVATHYDAKQQQYTITLTQTCAPTADAPTVAKADFVIPVRVALFTADGAKMSLGPAGDERLLVLTQRQQPFHFSAITEPPIPSLLRDFSAPVMLEQTPRALDWAVLLQHDDDPFNRWEAGQKLYCQHILGAVAAGIDAPSDASSVKLPSTTPRAPDSTPLFTAFAAIIRTAARRQPDDAAFVAQLLTLPATSYLCAQVKPIDPHAIIAARQQLKQALAIAHHDELLACYHQCQRAQNGQPEPAQMAARALRDLCLDYLCAVDDATARDLCQQQLVGPCMTDQIHALANIARSARPDRADWLAEFYQQWQDEPLVVDKWLQVQAIVPQRATLGEVEQLTAHASFDARNPNKVYALIFGFSAGNPYGFHAADGSGYAFTAKWIAQLDRNNPQLAARLAGAFNGWQQYLPRLQQRMQEQQQYLAARRPLSRDVAEIVGKNLATDWVG